LHLIIIIIIIIIIIFGVLISETGSAATLSQGVAPRVFLSLPALLRRAALQYPRYSKTCFATSSALIRLPSTSAVILRTAGALCEASVVAFVQNFLTRVSRT
jgi:hypothetical protein